MALNRIVFSTCYCGLNSSNPTPNNDNCLLPRKLQVDLSSVPDACNAKAKYPKSCLDDRDSIFRKAIDDNGKAHAVAPSRQLYRDAVPGLGSGVGLGLVNGHGSQKRGRPPLGVPVRGRLAVAVDVDEVLGNFLSALNKFVADRYSSHHSVSEYYVYEFFKIWKCSRSEANHRVHEFFETSYFKNGIHPIPGAQCVLNKLSPFCDLSVVTSRQNVIKDHTLEWVEKYYPGLFQEIHFGNHFALDGKSRPKSEICRALGAQVLIDDNPRYAIECAEVGIGVLLFDLDNSYPWSKSDSAISHPLVTKVHNWDEVEQNLFSLVVM